MPDARPRQPPQQAARPRGILRNSQSHITFSPRVTTGAHSDLAKRYSVPDDYGYDWEHDRSAWACGKPPSPIQHPHAPPVRQSPRSCSMAKAPPLPHVVLGRVVRKIKATIKPLHRFEDQIEVEDIEAMLACAKGDLQSEQGPNPLVTTKRRKSLLSPL